jgi:hypothetical protein
MMPNPHNNGATLAGGTERHPDSCRRPPEDVENQEATVDDDGRSDDGNTHDRSRRSTPAASGGSRAPRGDATTAVAAACRHRLVSEVGSSDEVFGDRRSMCHSDNDGSERECEWAIPVAGRDEANATAMPVWNAVSDTDAWAVADRLYRRGRDSSNHVSSPMHFDRAVDIGLPSATSAGTHGLDTLCRDEAMHNGHGQQTFLERTSRPTRQTVDNPSAGSFLRTTAKVSNECSMRGGAGGWSRRNPHNDRVDHETQTGNPWLGVGRSAGTGIYQEGRLPATLAVSTPRSGNENCRADWRSERQAEAHWGPVSPHGDGAFTNCPSSVPYQRLVERTCGVDATSASARVVAPRWDAEERSRNPVHDRTPLSKSVHGIDNHKNVMKPQPFDGREPINSFLAHFDVCARFNRWSNEDCCFWLQWSLKGRAQQVLWDLPSAQLGSYQNLVRALRERYGSDHQGELYRIELRNRRRAPKESLSDVMQDIRRLMVLAYTATSSDMWESIAINSYLEALNDPLLALEVRKRGPTTLEMAYRESLLLEGFIKASESARAEETHGRRKEQARTAVPSSAKSLAAEQAEEQAWRKEIVRMQQDLQQQLIKHTEYQERHNQRLMDLFSSIATEQRKVGQDQNAQCASASSNGRAGESKVGAGPMRRTGGCFNCGESGHFARKCPRKCVGRRADELDQQRPPVARDQDIDAAGRAHESRHIAGSRTAYLPAVVNGKTRFCVLDTGSGVCVLPERYVRDYNEVRPTDQRLYAANGTEIEVVGESTIDLHLDGLSLKADCLVSEYVDEILLGLDWAEANGLEWDFKRRLVTISGRQFVLYSQNPTGCVRRVVLQQDTVIPPRCRANVIARTVYSSFQPSTAQWVTQSKEIVPRVHLARTVVKDQASHVVVQLMNTSNHAVELDKMTSLGRLEEASIVPNENLIVEPEFVEDLCKTVEPSFSVDTREKFKALLLKYIDVFSHSEYDLGCTAMVQHRINTEGNRPVRQPLRRQPMLQAIDEQLDLMQTQGIIQPCQSEWSSNIVMVRKKDGTMRFCIDYRQLNDRTVKDVYPLPRIDDCLDTLAGSAWFSTVDLKSGYHQVAMHPDDAHKTAFITRRGAFSFRVMPIGLCNAPVTFQRLMDVILAGVSFEACLVYLDDIIVFSKDIATHLERLEMLFERLRRANLKIKPSKCQFLRSSVDFLGYVVSSQGIETDPRKIDAVKNWPVPKRLKEVRSFVGLCGYYRRFVDRFSEVAAPLHSLTKKNAAFIWNDACNSRLSS